MRPNILFPLFAEISSLKGVGPRLSTLFARLCGPHLVDVLWHLPIDKIDRRYTSELKYADNDRITTLTVTVVEHVPPPRRSLPYRIIAEDGTAQITLTYFNVKGDYLGELFPNGKPIVISGFLERYRGGWVMNHPEYAVPLDKKDTIPALEPIYPLTAGITNKMMNKVAKAALTRVPDLPEWHDSSLMSREKWPPWKDAITLAHDLIAQEKSPHASTFRRRLAYDELLADQLGLAVIRRHHRAISGRVQEGDNSLRSRLLAALPFALTDAQNEAFAEISADMASSKRMLRLLQGDVGSGKTIVALLAMLQAVESGAQAALMVPTEILARQHAARLNSFLAPLGLSCGLLVGKAAKKERAETLQKLEDGTLKLVVGTHALFQSDVAFHNLGLAVVDEQHRFGVQQRLTLSEKGSGVDILVMTATPIPRTLTLTAYGDMDVSRLLQKPEGRKPIDTRLIDLARLDEVIAAIQRKISTGDQVYWVCPLVEESEVIDLAAATERAELLRTKLGPDTVGLIHGRMTTDEKEAVMEAFLRGHLKVLVATTVIEVGVDVPNATIMIVEHAERFGLAQLHQLRGRVGRSDKASSCLLLHPSFVGETAKARLKMMRESQDGFLLAEEDLRLRGPGEILGKRQSGLQAFRLASLETDSDLLKMAHDDALLILNKDPDLTSERGKALRTLLYLFERDAAVGLFRAG